MKHFLPLLLALMFCSPIHAEKMKTYKKDVTIWYEAFNKNDSTLLDKILSENWVDIPPAPGQPSGPAGAKQILVELTKTFPDLKVTIQDVLQEGNKVVVRSEISGTQKASFMGFPSKSRKLVIQAIDIHEFKDGKIIRTWHTEDWMTGFHQLDVFAK
ncbi:ester cyclase [Pedosphaera parvula]|uniref:Ester cyclase n=1 Tax=Pedosphaera parvula (strain Ellin514) TaxID=320771 RepID=B9XJ34_PEDPL|nr:ester cyclase [Pedosphaera parvula]EEF60072.1 protein of unknown function DUF1486 [Pedosphaera parvula Ellin514]